MLTKSETMENQIQIPTVLFYTRALPPFFLGLTVGTLVAAAGVLGEVACPSAQGEFFPLPI